MPIVNFAPQNPMLDGRQSERALLIRRGVMRHFQEAGMALIAELPLASGRRADLIGMDRRGRFTIVEIKSSVEDFRADGKWPDYLMHCDDFFFATHAGVPQEIFPAEQGLIIADHFGAEIMRGPVAGNLAGATRKALTLRFARAAAWRLERVLAHHEASGGVLPDGFSAIDGD